MGIDLAAELKMAPKDLGLFWLVVVTPDRGDVLKVPLLLDGSEIRSPRYCTLFRMLWWFIVTG